MIKMKILLKELCKNVKNLQGENEKLTNERNDLMKKAKKLANENISITEIFEKIENLNEKIDENDENLDELWNDVMLKYPDFDFQTWAEENELD